MRKLGSFLVVLLIITAYGRCVADQFGMLHTSGSACCQTTCSSDSHCSQLKTSPAKPSTPTFPNDHTENHDHEHTDSLPVESDGSDKSNQSDEPNNPEAPCQLCLIISSDAMVQAHALEIPSPTLFELSPYFFNFSIERLLVFDIASLSLDLLIEDPVALPTEHRSQLRRTIVKTTPVRGPSIV